MKKKFKMFKHQILITSICVFALVVSLISGSYALFTSQSSSGEYNYLKVGDLELSYVDSGAGYGDVLNLNGAYPQSDSEGIKNTPYRFSIENTGSVTADFKIKIAYDEAVINEHGCSNNLLGMEYIKIKFDQNDPILLGNLSDSDYTVYLKNNFIVGDSEIHEIRVWITDDAPNSVLGKHFHGKVVVESIQSGTSFDNTKTYSIGDSVTLVDNSKWHVLENSSNTSATVTLLSDYVLNADGTYNTSCTSGACSANAFDSENLRPTSTNSYCLNDSNGCNMYSKNNKTTIKDSLVKEFIDNTYYPSLKQSIETAGGNTSNLEVSIPKANQIANAQNKTFSQTQLSLDDDFLTNISYWTQTASESDTAYVWYVDSTNKNLTVAYANNNTVAGYRPVIKILKENIK